MRSVSAGKNQKFFFLRSFLLSNRIECLNEAAAKRFEDIMAEWKSVGDRHLYGIGKCSLLNGEVYSTIVIILYNHK